MYKTISIDCLSKITVGIVYVHASSRAQVPYGLVLAAAVVRVVYYNMRVVVPSTAGSEVWNMPMILNGGFTYPVRTYLII